MNPDRVGDYELLEYLTAGGMADLYLARSPRLPGPVVLKTIQRKYVDHTRVVKMFVDEGRIAKVLDHPNIVRIYDVGADRGAYFIVMEFIPGRDLLAVARRGIEAGRFLPLHLAVAIVAQVATGLTYAHEKRDDEGISLRVVHCDISPGNVVVSFGGTAKIVDFGIARAAIQLRAEDHTVVGKYNYMAPEQIRGEPLDARADLFSLGVILYELTVGRRLFRGTPEDVKARVLAGDIIPPREINPELPETLERIILRTLELDPKRRYARARDLRSDLRAVLASDGRPAGKREIAEYLRDIFVPPPKAEPVEVVEGDEAFARDVGEGDDELALDMPIPGLHDVVADLEDPEPLEAPPPDSDELGRLEAHAELEAPRERDDTAPTLVDAPTVPTDAPAPAAPVADSPPQQEPSTPPEPTAPPSAQPEPSSEPAPRSDSAITTKVDVSPIPAEARPISRLTTKVDARPMPKAETHPYATRSELAVAVLAVVAAILAYLLLRNQ